MSFLTISASDWSNRDDPEKACCARNIFDSSSVILVLAISNAPDWILPRPVAAGMNGTMGAAGKATTGGFPWGMAISICADIIISVGLALQKAGHNIIETRRAKAEDAASVGEATSLRVWRLGLTCMISGEIGNLVACAPRR